MKKKILLAMALAILLACRWAPRSPWSPSSNRRGLSSTTRHKSYGGYQLFSGTGAGNTISYLIDMEGYVVNEWKRDYVVSLHEWLLPNGNLLVAQKPWTLPVPPEILARNPNVKTQEANMAYRQHADDRKRPERRRRARRPPPGVRLERERRLGVRAQ